MMTKTIKQPGPDHPITIAAGTVPVSVKAGGSVIAESAKPLMLREASYPPVAYIPAADADMSLLVRSDHSTYCPYKGECSYYHIKVGPYLSRNAVWSYEAPYEAVAEIKGHLAFYPDRVDSIS